jgi:hypothetical protein
MRIGRRWIIPVILGVVLCSFIVPVQEAGALIRVGGGLGLVGGEVAPLGRVTLDVLPLVLVTLSFDPELWIFSAGNQQLLPFVTVRTALILNVFVGVAPIVTISAQGIGLVSNTLAFKGGVGAPIGPLEVFVEGIFIATPIPEIVNGPFLAAGVTLGF